MGQPGLGLPGTLDGSLGYLTLSRHRLGLVAPDGKGTWEVWPQGGGWGQSRVGWPGSRAWRYRGGCPLGVVTAPSPVQGCPEPLVGETEAPGTFPGRMWDEPAGVSSLGFCGAQGSQVCCRAHGPNYCSRAERPQKVIGGLLAALSSRCQSWARPHPCCQCRQTSGNGPPRGPERAQGLGPQGFRRPADAF